MRWVSQTQPAWVVCDTGNAYYKPQAAGSLQPLDTTTESGGGDTHTDTAQTADK